MKTSTLKFLVTTAVLFGGSLAMTGCAKSGLEWDPLSTPAYSASENFHRQTRVAAYNWQQAIDDFDRDVVMSRPASTLTKWHVRQSD
jgi:hypothetical protein